MSSTRFVERPSTAVTPDAKHGSWVTFAAVMLGLVGLMRIFDAIWAFRYNGAVPQHLQDAIFGTSLDTYGWVYLIVGCILLASSLFVMTGSQVARWTGVVAAGLSTVSATWWMPYYPVWSLTYIALGALVIYALLEHADRSQVDR